MRLALFGSIAAFIVACAASDDVTTSSSSVGPGSGGSPTATSSGAGELGGFGIGGGTDPCAGGGRPSPECDCQDLSFVIDTQQACSISVLDGFELDGEGFITVQSQQHRVFAIDRWGSGHIIGWCDSTTLPELLGAFDVLGYLGQVDNPRIASFGDMFLCQPGALPTNLPVEIEYQGEDLPAMYQGNAAALAADWDVLIFCGFRIPWTYGWAAEIADFVTVHGKGFLASMEYEGVAMAQDFTNMSAITSPSGIVFNPLNLPWAPASTNVELDCVPDVPPPPK
ncbi:MAG TPA: hypothetical protein VFB62_03470 [Polyangiaceae bacterium]|nr:hypothetical protein [Polyangiaceae bacterium]